MKRYIRSSSEVAKMQTNEMKQVGHAIQASAKSYPEPLRSAPYKDYNTGEVSRVKVRILSSIKYANTTQCFVSISFNCIVENTDVSAVAEYAIDMVKEAYPEFDFRFGKYGSFRGHDLGVWITRKG